MSFPKLNMTVKLHTKFEDCNTFCSNIKMEKRDFLSPINLTEKRLTLHQKKAPWTFLCIFFDQNNDPI